MYFLNSKMYLYNCKTYLSKFKQKLPKPCSADDLNAIPVLALVITSSAKFFVEYTTNVFVQLVKCLLSKLQKTTKPYSADDLNAIPIAALVWSAIITSSAKWFARTEQKC